MKCVGELGRCSSFLRVEGALRGAVPPFHSHVTQLAFPDKATLSQRGVSSPDHLAQRVPLNGLSVSH